MKITQSMLLAMAVCIVSLMLTPFIPDSGIQNLLILVAVASVGYFVFVTVKGVRRDPYSLQALQETHEREEIRSLIDAQEKVLDGPVVCLHCGTEFDSSRSICPRCGARAGSRCS
ncbi:MAG TPA: hypothetical protein PKA27_07095 [Fimbriimonadaceae bacterium]|nr:hypothetical protein [Fimbriimonadaceae bacterium]